MVAGLNQLAATGKMNRFLTCEPQVTFFKMQYRRHVHFAVVTKSIEFNGPISFGQRCTCSIPHHGDVLQHLILNLRIPNLNPNATRLPHMDLFWVNNIGHTIVSQIDLVMNGKIVDRQTGMWMELWTELTQAEDKRRGFSDMIGKIADEVTSTTDYEEYGREMSLLIPLQFWFSRQAGTALPLAMMSKTKIELHVTLRPFNECVVSRSKSPIVQPPGYVKAAIYADYVLIDEAGRRDMVKIKDHPHLNFNLVDQVQHCSKCIFDQQKMVTIRLPFNRPVKELIWFYQRQDVGPPNNQWFNFGLNLRVDAINQDIDTIETAQLKFNGSDRTIPLTAKYLRSWYPYTRHTRTPSKPIYVYSFALKPEDIQPTGNCNFSKINNAIMVIKFKKNKLPGPGTIKIYAVNHNVMRFKNGYAGLVH